MIAEAIDAAVTVGWALLVWIVLAAVAATAALYAVVAVAWWVWRGVRRLSAELPIPALIASRERPNPSPAPPSHRKALNASPSPEFEKEHIA